jgi:transposase-like protein
VITTFCPICFSSSNERASIDNAIKSSRERFDSIARRLGVSRRVVQRHRDHLSEAPKSEPTTVVIAPVYNINLVVSLAVEERDGGADPEAEELLGSIATEGEGGYA